MTSMARGATRLMQVALGGIFLVGVASRNVAVLVNAALALAVTFLPAVLERDVRVSLGPRVSLWITLAVFLHAVGMLGLYATTWWWDHLTHTLSAALVAAVGYAATRALDRYSDALYLPPAFLFAFTLLFTLACGVLWEVLEFAARALGEYVGADPVLVQYGVDDSVLDIVFDGVGAVVVATFASSGLSSFVDRLSERP